MAVVFVLLLFDRMLSNILNTAFIYVFEMVGGY